MNEKVSIIFPVYNVEQYIETSLYSIIRQDYQNIELVIVDDCSTDESMKIVNNVLSNTKNTISFKIVKHDINKGLSAARNTGIKNSSGCFLYFLDSDDYISDNCISSLINIINSDTDLDYVIGNTKTLGNINENKYSLRLDNDILVGNMNISNAYYKGKWIVTAWNKLLKKEFILKYNLFFFEGILQEDELWSIQLTQKANKIAFCHAYTYYYLMRPSSIMNKTVSKDNIEGLFTGIVEAIKSLKHQKNKYLSGCIIILSIRMMNLLTVNFPRTSYTNIMIQKIKNTVPRSIIYQAIFLDKKSFFKTLTFFLPLNVTKNYLKFIYSLKK